MSIEFGTHARFDEGRYYPSFEELRRRLKEHPARDGILQYLERYKVPIDAALRWPRRDGAVLPDLGIIRHMLAGNVVIHPFNADQLGTNSYNVTLGQHFWRRFENVNGVHRLNAPRRADIRSFVSPRERARTRGGEETHAFAPSREELDEAQGPRIDTYNPLDEGNVRFVWRKGEAQLAAEVERVNNLKFEGIFRDDRLIMLHPHEMILAHTQEFVGGLNVVVTSISGKSTAGRNMIEVCSDANVGNIGFFNRWTLEIRNKGDKLAIPLVVGEPYAQITFYESQPAATSYAATGLYQSGESIQQVVDFWTPEMMLPRMGRLRQE